MFSLYLKHLLIRTPLERPAFALRSLLTLPAHHRHSELQEIYLEDERTEQLLERYLEPDSSCIDVGSHIGGMLTKLIRIAPQGHHLAFEPVARKAAWLRKKFPEVELHNAALSEQAGEADFYESLSQPGFSSLGAPDSEHGRSRAIRVRCETLDQLLDHPQRFALLKIDVEGAELFVLRGGRRLIARDQPLILFESSHDGAARLGLTREALFDFITLELGYTVYLIRDLLASADPLDRSGFQQAAVYPYQAFNFAAVHP